MTGWIINCSENERREFLEEGFVRHSDELSISRGDEIYLHDTHEDFLVGHLTALITKPSDSDEASEKQTAIQATDTDVQMISADDAPDFSRGELSSRVHENIELAFQYDGEPVEIDAKENRDSDHGQNNKVDSIPPDATLTDVLTNEHDAKGRDFSGESAPTNQVVGDLVLRGSDFSGAELEGVTFRGTDLRDTDFRGANLEDATFEEDAKIQGADFTKAQMKGVELATDVTASIFTHTVLTDADLTEAKLAGADFSEAYMKRADFGGTNPDRVNFEGAKLAGMKTSGSTFEHSSFVDADLKGVDFGNSKLYDCDFTDARLKNADLSEADLNENDFTDAHMNPVDMSGAEIEGHNFQGADMESAVLENVSAEGASFQGARLTDAIFTDATLVGTSFVSTQVNEATFNGADLTGATFAQADLFGSSFTDARLYGCHLASARVDSNDPFDDKCIYERSESSAKNDSPKTGRNTEAATPDEKAASVYRTLEAVMDSNSQTTEALRYFFLRKEASRRVHRDKRHIGQYLVSSLSRYLVSHGINFRWLGMWILFIFLGAATTYAWFDLLRYQGEILSMGPSLDTSVETIGLSLLFSAYSFTGLGFGEFQPVGIGRVISVSQTAVGILFFALFIYIFTTKASR